MVFVCLSMRKSLRRQLSPGEYLAIRHRANEAAKELAVRFAAAGVVLDADAFDRYVGVIAAAFAAERAELNDGLRAWHSSRHLLPKQHAQAKLRRPPVAA